MSVNVSLLSEVDAAFREAQHLPPTYVLSEADYKDIEACHAKWVKAGGLGRLPSGKEAPLRAVVAVKSGPKRERASYMYKDKVRQQTPPTLLPEVLAFLTPGVGEAAAAAAARAADALARAKQKQ